MVNLMDNKKFGLIIIGISVLSGLLLLGKNDTEIKTISETSQLRDGLVAHFSFDQAKNDVIRDSVSGFDGIVHGAVIS